MREFDCAFEVRIDGSPCERYPGNLDVYVGGYVDMSDRIEHQRKWHVGQGRNA